MKANAAYVQVPTQITFREIELPPPGPREVLLEVLACGICGHDKEIVTELAAEPKPFGHEVVCVVKGAGERVRHVKPGDQVVLESSSFCGECELCRNARVDLCAKAPSFMDGLTGGFADALLTPAQAVVPCNGMDPLAAVLAEPCGVAMDMVKVAEPDVSDNVLVVGTGAIGLMALSIVRHRTGGLVVGADLVPGRLAVAERLGADATVNLNEASLAECGKPFGGFHRVLNTAHPSTLPDSLEASTYGGVVVWIGFDWGEGGKVTFDTTRMHLGKKQLRASFASPAVYLPEALDLLRRGVVPAAEIVSHTFPLSQLPEAFALLDRDHDTTRKVVVIPDAHFQRLGRSP